MPQTTPMAERCAFRHFGDLAPHQQKQMFDVLNRTHGAPDEPEPQIILTGGRPVALLKDGKVIAALVTDEHHNVLHWAGVLNTQFTREMGQTPAEAILREHLARRGDGKIEFVGQASDAAIDLFYRKYFDPKHTQTYRNGPNNGIHFSEQALKNLQPAVRSQDQVWRLYRSH